MLVTRPVPSELELLQRDGAVGLRIRAKPGARRSAILGVEQGALVVAVAAPAREGLANQELIRLFARVANVHQRQVELVSGVSGRYKLVRIHGLQLDPLRKLLLSNLQNH